MLITDKYVFFWGSYDIYSNFYQPCKLYVKEWNKLYPMFVSPGQDIVFNCSEQYFMVAKALTFNDCETASKIMCAEWPRQQKALGRKVKNFNEEKWDKHKKDIMTAALLYKFNQNVYLREALLSTGDRLLVEASPKDKIWGIGLSEDIAVNTQECHWPGQNLLGKALVNVRNMIMSMDKLVGFLKG